MFYNKILKEAKSIGLGQIDNEWLNFVKFLDNIKPKVVLEIGTNKGGSAYTLANFAKHLICIDIVDRCRAKKEIGEKCKFDFIVGNSAEENIINLVKEKLQDQKIDLIFIDGDHSYEGAKADFNNYVKLVNAGGYIAFHDIVKSKKHIRKKCLVFKLWDELKAKYPNAIEYKSGADWAGIGIIKI